MFDRVPEDVRPLIEELSEKEYEKISVSSKVIGVAFLSNEYMEMDEFRTHMMDREATREDARKQLKELVLLLFLLTGATKRERTSRR